MGAICEGRVVIVTGAGRGIGREHALLLAREGARVVVNDLGVSSDGSGGSGGPADEVVAAIRAAGGEAIANTDDVADWDGGARLVQSALDAWGRLDVVVNNAGILRDRMFVSSEAAEWEAVLRVHVMGHVCVARHAAAWWRGRSKAGEPVAGRIINTSSGAGLQGSVGQAAYAAAKGAIASLTLVQAAELGRYGATANAIAPAARTRMTETAFPRHDGDPRHRIRPDAPGQHRAPGGLARQRGIGGCDRAGVRGGGRGDQRRGRLAAWSQGRVATAAGSPTRSTPRCAPCSTRPSHRRLSMVRGRGVIAKSARPV